MTPPSPAHRHNSTATAPATGRAAAVAGALEAAMIEALAQERPEARPTLASLQLDLSGDATTGEALALTVWIERATRTLAFVAADAHANGTRIASAAAIFDLGA